MLPNRPNKGIIPQATKSAPRPKPTPKPTATNADLAKTLENLTRIKGESRRLEQTRNIQENREKAKLVVPLTDISSTIIEMVGRKDFESSRFCEIDNPKLPTNDDLSQTGNLYDLRMGTYKNGIVCQSCNEQGDKCQQHPGKITFTRLDANGFLEPNPIYSFYMPIIVKILNCACPHCARLFIPPRDAKQHFGGSKLALLARYEEESMKGKEIVCQSGNNCGKRYYYKIYQDKIFRSNKKPGRDANKLTPGDVEPVFPMEAWRIMRLIPDDEMKALGFTNQRPEDTLIFFGLLVIPPGSRPYRDVDGEITHHDFTNLYVEIIRHNNIIKTDTYASVEKDRRKVENYFFTKSRNLIDAINNLIQANKSSHKGKRDVKNLDSTLKGKEGIIRNLINGGHVNYCARTVASPGIKLRTDQIGIPIEFSHRLTPYEDVFTTKDASGKEVSNRHRLQALFNRDNDKPPQIVKVIRNSKIITINDALKTFELETGDRVFRFLEDGDVVLVNRNPTLHKNSILAFYVVLIPERSIRLPLPVSFGFNADFDGDELNIHLVQGPIAKAETIELMLVQNSLLSESRGSAIISATFNALVGSQRMTQPLVNLTHEDLLEQWYRLADFNTVELANDTTVISPSLSDFVARCVRNGVSPFSGKAMFSIVFPPNLQYHENLSSTQRTPIGYRVVEIEEIDGIKTRNVINDIDLEEKLVDDEISHLDSHLVEEFERKKYQFTITELLSSTTETEFIDGKKKWRETYLLVVEEKEIRIVDGILISGAMTKASIGSGARFLTFIFKNYTQRFSTSLISNIDYIANWFLERKPFSTGFEDMFDSDHFEYNMGFFEKKLDLARKKLTELGGVKGDTHQESLRQQTIISTMTSIVEDTGASLLKDPMSGFSRSSINSSIESGAKGKKSAAGQALMYGQQLEAGALIPQRMEGRISSFFPRGVYTPEAIGFCPSPLTRGITAPEMFATATSARRDMFNTKTKVSVSGYAQRRFATLLGGVVVDYFNESIYDIRGERKIVQFVYGETGISPGLLGVYSDEDGEFYSPIDVHQLVQNL